MLLIRHRGEPVSSSFFLVNSRHLQQTRRLTTTIKIGPWRVYLSAHAWLQDLIIGQRQRMSASFLSWNSVIKSPPVVSTDSILFSFLAITQIGGKIFPPSRQSFKRITSECQMFWKGRKLAAKEPAERGTERAEGPSSSWQALLVSV